MLKGLNFKARHVANMKNIGLKLKASNIGTFAID